MKSKKNKKKTIAKPNLSLSLSLFGMYIDEITNFIALKRCNGVVLGGTQVRILLYADDIVFISEFVHNLQRHLNALDDFCTHHLKLELSVT